MGKPKTLKIARKANKIQRATRRKSRGKKSMRRASGY